MIQRKLLETITLEERCRNYNQVFPKYPAPVVGSDGRISGIWMIGNNYRNKKGYYGEYPPSFLKRIFSLFPEIKDNNILQLFSGSLDSATKGWRFDINPNLNPHFIGDAHHLASICKDYNFKLIIADPPYSSEDAKHYGTPMINRNKVLKECEKLLKLNGYLCWLDQVLPMYRKVDLNLIGIIGVIRSTNHRVRAVFMYQKIKEVEA